MRDSRGFIIALLSSALLANETDIPYEPIGKIVPRHANDIAGNNFSIGAETQDRGLIELDSYKDHLEPLGAKQIRLQAGWARCEKVKGKYDWRWLDEIIDHAISQGVQPWLQTSYGNTIYEGGGGIHLTGSLPSSDEALTAWDNWVRAMVQRYQGRVHVWEIWNEADHRNSTVPEDYAAFYIRTAEIIRAIDPDATLYALALASTGEKGREFAKVLLDCLQTESKLNLVDEITVHGYTSNPDSVYDNMEQFQAFIGQYDDRIVLRQGELGCPSEFQTVYALKNYPWTETSQAKWALRKMLGDLGRDIPSSYFMIIDPVYTHHNTDEMDKPQRNTKGLLQADLQRKFVKRKQAYYAYQNVTSIFDNKLQRIIDLSFVSNTQKSVSVFGYQHEDNGASAVTIWFDDERPSNSLTTLSTRFQFPELRFDTPVCVDLRTGVVYEIPNDQWRCSSGETRFDSLPIYDCPIVVAEKSLLKIKDHGTDDQ